MTTRKYANNFTTTLNGSITDVQTTITLTSDTGLPAIGAGEVYRLTIVEGSNIEVVEVTDDASTPTLTVTRGVDGTSGTAFGDGSVVELRVTADSHNDVLAADTSPQLRGTLDCDSNAISNGTTASFDTSVSIGGNATAAGFIELLEDSDNGSNKTTIQGNASISSDFTLILPDAQTTNDNGFLTWDTSGNATWEDYEEGTWTPTLVGQSTAGSPTYTDQTGTYTKIGNRVICHVRVDWTALGGLLGNVEIHGLPFTSFNSASRRAFLFFTIPSNRNTT